MYKIAINARYLLPGKIEGTGRFTLELMSRLVHMRPDYTFYLLYDREQEAYMIEAPNVQHHVIWPPARHPALWFVWGHMQLPFFLKKNKIDLYIGTEGFVPLRGKPKTISVIHDLNFEHIQTQLPWSALWYYKHMYPRYAKACTRVVTVSQYSASDIANTYGIEQDKISVVYNAASELFMPVNADEKQKTIQLITGGKPYFVYLGSVNPRKNIVGLLRAFEKYKSTSSDEIKLVIVGNTMHGNSALDTFMAGMKHINDVIFTGYLHNDSMIEALASAEALVYVPLFEGFGIPVIEAMKCGVPVIASNVTSLPEVAGDAALLVQPNDTEAIAQCMFELRTNPQKRLSLIQAGFNRAKTFSWEKSAMQLAQIVDSILDE